MGKDKKAGKKASKTPVAAPLVLETGPEPEPEREGADGAAQEAPPTPRRQMATVAPICGLLQKLNRKDKWQTRYFKVDTDGSMLQYFKDEKAFKKNEAPLGEVSLVGSVVVACIDEWREDPTTASLRVMATERSLLLKHVGEDTEVVNRWNEYLDHVVGRRMEAGRDNLKAHVLRILYKKMATMELPAMELPIKGGTLAVGVIQMADLKIPADQFAMAIGSSLPFRVGAGGIRGKVKGVDYDLKSKLKDDKSTLDVDIRGLSVDVRIDGKEDLSTVIEEASFKRAKEEVTGEDIDGDGVFGYDEATMGECQLVVKTCEVSLRRITITTHGSKLVNGLIQSANETIKSTIQVQLSKVISEKLQGLLDLVCN